MLLCGFLGYLVGSNSWYIDNNNKIQHFNTENARLQEVKYCNACLEALHWFYRNDTVFWNNTFMLTKEYKNIEVANNGDWEDFYAPNWK